MSLQKVWDSKNPVNISEIRNKESIGETVMEKYPELKDEYNDRDNYRVSERDQKNAENILSQLTDEEKAVLSKDFNYYEIKFKNIGGLIMPIIIELVYEDGSTEQRSIPVEIWRFNSKEITKVFVTEKVVKEFILDPNLETADTDRDNNYFPQRNKPTRFEMYKNRER